MSELQRMRRVIALAHVEKHDDELVREAVELLQTENVRLREADARNTVVIRKGRNVVGRAVAAFVLAFGLMLGILWWRYSEGAVEFRQGYHRGYNDAKR